MAKPAPIYPACRIKRRRRTNAQMEADFVKLIDITRGVQPATVRQVFYLATIAGIVPKTELGYDRVQRDLVTLRREGRIPYSWITDATRWVRRPQTFGSVEAALRETAKHYRRSLWQDSPVAVEVWLEKDTLAGTIIDVTGDYDVPLMVSRGFTSDSYLYECAEAISNDDRPYFIYYIGDLDPSGLKIDQTIAKKLREFAEDSEVHVERLAVRPEQVSQWGLVTGTPKRAKNAHAKDYPHGFTAEADAINPVALRQLVRDAIEQHIRPEQLNVLLVAERSERAILERLAASLRKPDGGRAG
jgi:hypothetical protein